MIYGFLQFERVVFMRQANKKKQKNWSSEDGRRSIALDNSREHDGDDDDDVGVDEKSSCKIKLKRRAMAGIVVVILLGAAVAIIRVAYQDRMEQPSWQNKSSTALYWNVWMVAGSIAKNKSLDDLHVKAPLSIQIAAGRWRKMTDMPSRDFSNLLLSCDPQLNRHSMRLAANGHIELQILEGNEFVWTEDRRLSTDGKINISLASLSSY